MLAHFLDHEIRRTYRIVGNAAGLDDRIHLLVGLIQVIDNLDSGLFFELINDGFINVLAPVVNVELAGVTGCGRITGVTGNRAVRRRSAAAGYSKCHCGQCRSRYDPSFFHFLNLLLYCVICLNFI